MKEEFVLEDFISTTRQGFIVQNDIEWEALEDGIRRKILGYDENLMMAISEFKKGAVGYIHAHPHRQTTYIVHGKFEVQIGDEKKVLKEGDSFFLIPSQNHGVLALEDSILVDIFAPYREDFLAK